DAPERRHLAPSRAVDLRHVTELDHHGPFAHAARPRDPSAGQKSRRGLSPAADKLATSPLAVPIPPSGYPRGHADGMVEGLFDNSVSSRSACAEVGGMRRMILGLALVTALAFGVVVAPARGAAPDAASESFFELKVRPVLAGTCVKCHGEKKASG